MRKITRGLIWLYVFTVPWDVVTLPMFGSMSRLTGLAAIMAAVITTAAGLRFRRPDPILGAAVLFAVWSAMSLVWTVSYGASYQRAFTYAQLVAAVWMIREFIVTREQQQSLLVAFCMGAFVPLVDLFKNFRENIQISMAGRFSGGGVNANDLGTTLVIGMPIAWYLVMQRRGFVRVVAVIFFALAPLAIMLTGTRGAFLAGLVALLIIPFSLPRQSMKTYATACLLVVLAGVGLAVVVPRTTWARISTTSSEITEGGSMTGRMKVWRAGLQVFPEHAILGVGVGAYGPAVESILNSSKIAPHSVPLAILVEQGIVGITIFALLLAACARTIRRLAPAERTLWSVLMMSWFVGVLTINWEYRKATWMLFGLLAAQGAAKMAQAHAARSPARAPLGHFARGTGGA